MFAMFLRLRYYQSAQTRSAFGYVSKQVDAVSAHPSCPDPVKKGLNTARDLVRAILLHLPAAKGAGH